MNHQLIDNDYYKYKKYKAIYKQLMGGSEDYYSKYKNIRICIKV